MQMDSTVNDWLEQEHKRVQQHTGTLIATTTINAQIKLLNDR